MKKLLSVLAAVGITAVGSTSLAACKKTETSAYPSIKDVKVTYDTEISIKAADVKKPTADEAKSINENDGLKAAVLAAVQAKVKEATAADFTISNDAEGKDLTAAADVKITVKATKESKKISGEFSFTVKVKAEAGTPAPEPTPTPPAEG